ncbi:hypothetical protein [Tenacibaculum litopenaei]|uniref:hypothetical protein n=1 Tax=Tenacibaculum litopenaei TaxID=396016 RepID=UPI0038B47612
MKTNLKKLGTELSKQAQRAVMAGFGPWPTNEQDCLACGGEWGGLCALPIDSPCL